MATAQSLTARAGIHIGAPASAVWHAITDPATIKQYFFGVDAVSDWKVGSTITYSGTWEGKPFEDKGRILRNEKDKLFQISYTSGKTEDESNPEIISYRLSEEAGGTRLDVIQENVPTAEEKARCEQNWNKMLESMKDLLER